MSDFKIIRQANVELDNYKRVGKNAHELSVLIDGEHAYTFGHTSRISQALDTNTPEQLVERLDGGTYFMLDNGEGFTLVDFRDGNYNGFVHTDESIQHLIDIIGVQEGKHISGENHTDRRVTLSRVWSDHDIVIPEYQVGGEFTSSLSFAWNPFMNFVRSAYKITRLVCTNGMIGTASFLNTRVPIINRWEEHLDIASRQTQNKITSKVNMRMSSMHKERVSVADCLQVMDHIVDRLKNPSNDYHMLLAIAKIVSPSIHLSNKYNEKVFEDRRLAAQMPAHLDAFTLWNAITELNSHTQPGDTSSAFALNKMANRLLFDGVDATASAARFEDAPASLFVDPKHAFLGKY